MKNIKKLLVALIALVLVAGCSSSNNDIEETVTPTPVVTEDSVDTTSHAPNLDELKESGANLSEAVVYGVYDLEGETADSSIECTVITNMDTNEVVYINFDEALLPYSTGGAHGFTQGLDEETVNALGANVLMVDETVVPLEVVIGGITWTAINNDGIEYVADINGETVSFVDYVATQEGGACYHQNLSADLIGEDGSVVLTIEIETKISSGHGLDFWPSDITFAGNINLIENVVYDNGVNYDYYPEASDIAQNENGIWVVSDVVSSATLAGAPNYFNMIKEAYDIITSGNGITVE